MVQVVHTQTHQITVKEGAAPPAPPAVSWLPLLLIGGLVALAAYEEKKKEKKR